MKFLSSCLLKKAIQATILSAGLVLVCVSLFAQGNAGRILGAITDQTGGAISGATVTVTDVQRGVARALTTDESGSFNAPNLTPGTYKVRAEFKGFKAVERDNVLLETGGEVRVDLTLQPGEQTQTITVTEAAAAGGNHQRRAGGTLQSDIVNNLPLEWPQLLEPAATAPRRHDLSGWLRLGSEHQRHAGPRQRLHGGRNQRQRPVDGPGRVGFGHGRRAIRDADLDRLD